MNVKTTLAAALLAAAGLCSAASAETLIYDTWSETDSPSTSPLITITDQGASTFLLNVALQAGSPPGSIITLYFDVGTDYAKMNVVASEYSPSDLASTTGVVAPSAIPSPGKSGALQGVPDAVTLLFDFALAFDKADGVGSNSVSFNLKDNNSVLELSDFYWIGVRVQEVGMDGEGSDKLWGVATPMTPVPLPAAGWMLLAVLGGLVTLGRGRLA